MFALLDDATQVEPEAASLAALATMVVAAALSLRGSAVLRLWGPVAGMVVGCGVAAALGIFDTGLVAAAPWVGLPTEWPGLALDFGLSFWTLAPSFLFLGVITAIQANGDDDGQDDRQLIVLASSEGPVADSEFIGGGDDDNLEDRLRQLQQHDAATPVEQEISLRLLRNYASSAQHQQYHDTDIITVRVEAPGVG